MRGWSFCAHSVFEGLYVQLQDCSAKAPRNLFSRVYTFTSANMSANMVVFDISNVPVVPSCDNGTPDPANRPCTAPSSAKIGPRGSAIPPNVATSNVETRQSEPIWRLRHLSPAYIPSSRPFQWRWMTPPRHQLPNCLTNQLNQVIEPRLPIFVST